VDTIAAFGVMNQLWSYVQMPAVAVGGAVSAMVAQNIGADKWGRVSKIVWAGIGINVLMTSTLLGVITFGAVPILSLFLPSGSAATTIAVHINLLIGWSYILMGVSMVVTFAVRANGAMLMPLLILIVSAVFIRFGIGFGFYDRYGAEAIWWAFNAAGIASCLLSIVYYRFGGWRDMPPPR
jgi:Na+-driven multidrug efflux pump